MALHRDINWRFSASRKFMGALVVTSLSAWSIRQLISRFRNERVKKLATKRECAQKRYRTSKLDVLHRLFKLIQDDQSLRDQWKLIINMPFSNLQRSLHDGKLKALDVLHAFQFHALLADLDSSAVDELSGVGACRDDFLATNCIVQPIVEAEELAAQLDSLDESSRRSLPLFGIPVSLKESFAVRGYESACGYSRLLESFSKDDSLLFLKLKASGAVPFAIGCVPQTLMTYASDNPITGQTNHPLNASFSPGGSSSGDACLASLRGAPLTFGSDLGGSIRVPAAMCGVFGMSCTPARFQVNAPSRTSIPMQLEPSYGPFSTDVAAIIACLQAFWKREADYNGLSDYRYPLPIWNEELFSAARPLRIGYFYTNEIIEPLPAVRRAIDNAKRILERNGHVLVEWSPPKTREAWLTVREGWAPYYEVLRLLEDDCVADSIVYLLDEFRISKIRRKWEAFYLRYQGKDLEAEMLEIYCDPNKAPINNYLATCRKVSAYRDDFMRSWSAAKLDVVLCPAFATCALPHDLMARAVACSTYSSLFSLMNFCGGVAPVSRVIDEDIDAGERQDWPSVNLYDRQLAAEIRKALKETKDMPLAVQVAAAPFKDELVLRVMKELSDSIGERL